MARYPFLSLRVSRSDLPLLILVDLNLDAISKIKIVSQKTKQEIAYKTERCKDMWRYLLFIGILLMSEATIRGALHCCHPSP